MCNINEHKWGGGGAGRECESAYNIMAIKTH